MSMRIKMLSVPEMKIHGLKMRKCLRKVLLWHRKHPKRAGRLIFRNRTCHRPLIESALVRFLLNIVFNRSIYGKLIGCSILNYLCSFCAGGISPNDISWSEHDNLWSLVCSSGTTKMSHLHRIPKVWHKISNRTYSSFHGKEHIKFSETIRATSYKFSGIAINNLLTDRKECKGKKLF